MSIRILLLAAAGVSCAGAAFAHDLWLQPSRFWVAPRAATPVAIFVGHGKDRGAWGVSSDRVVVLRSIGPGGAVDHLSTIRGRTAAEIPALSLTTPGTHVLALQSTHASSELPAGRFNDYLKEEGLTPAITARARTRSNRGKGREIYSRRAKALVQVGPRGGAQRHVTRPIGMTLEIVPEQDPYSPTRPELLPVRVLYEGRPLPGALVKFTNLDADAKPVATAITDRRGAAAFRVPRTGSWLLNVVWTKPIKGDPRGEFDTTFSSLTFGYPATGSPRR